MTVNFDDMDLNNLKPGSLIWDEVVTGLCLMVHQNKNSFHFKYRTRSGIQRNPKIGEYPRDSINEVRRRAKILAGRAALGEDPKGIWDESKAERMRVSELFELAFDKHWASDRYSKSGYGVEVKRLYKRDIASPLGDLSLFDLTPTFVRDWHRSMAKKPTEANRALSVLSRLFTFAQEEEIVPQGTNPCALVNPFPPKKRSRYANPEELKRINAYLAEAMKKKRTRRAAVFTYVLMYSGARPRSIEHLTEENFKRVQHNGKIFGVLSFEGKNTADTGEMETVVLPPNITEMIENLRKDGPVIKIKTFRKRQADNLIGIKIPYYFWRKLTEDLGCTDLWIRDFRRTFATLGMDNHIPASIIGEALNHKSVQTTRTYAKLTLKTQLDAVEKIANALGEIVQEPKGET